MPRLNHSELQAFSNTLLELYSPGPLADLPARIFASLAGHVSCEHCSYHEFSDKMAVRVVHKPEARIDTTIFNHYVDQHPGIVAIIRDQIRSSVKFQTSTL